MSELNAAGIDRLFTNGLEDFDRLTLHSGDPGADGTGNVVSDAPEACSWAAAESDAGSGRQRALAAAVDFTGATPTTAVAYFGLWDHNEGDPVYLGRIARESGDATTNADGEYSVKTGTKITLEMGT